MSFPTNSPVYNWYGVGLDRSICVFWAASGVRNAGKVKQLQSGN